MLTIIGVLITLGTVVTNDSIVPLAVIGEYIHPRLVLMLTFQSQYGIINSLK